jgi:S1-C subfamily serine protease
VNESKVKDWIVKILPSETAERAEGTGFWATLEGYVLTCWHVVEQIEKPWVEYKGKRDYIEKSWHIGDIALLLVKELKGPPAILDLQSNWDVGNKIYSLGFQYEGRQGEIVLGYFPVGEGEITGDTEIDGYGAVALKEAVHVDQGASGAPALNRDTGKVIGLIGAK